MDVVHAFSARIIFVYERFVICELRHMNYLIVEFIKIAETFLLLPISIGIF